MEPRSASFANTSNSNEPRTNESYQRRRASAPISGLNAGACGAKCFRVNGLYDINTGTQFTPYVGAGVGFVNASLSGARLAGSPIGTYNGSDTGFAYQAIAGVSYAVTPRLSLTVDYRYVATDATVKSGGTRWDVENANHIFTTGFRWAFGN